VHRVRVARNVAIVTAALVAGVAVLRAQTPQFRASVDVVEVEATVLDWQRRPIRGLTQAHFSVYEDGKLQPIVLFSEDEFPESDGPLSTAVEDTAPDVSQPRYADRRLIAVVLDDFSLTPGIGSTQIVYDTKAIAKDIVAQMGVKDFVAIVLTRDTRYFPDFTNNRRKLFDQIDAFKPPEPIEKMWLQSISRNRMGGMVALMEVAGYMENWPSHRKSIIYVSRGEGGSFLSGTLLHRTYDLIKIATEAGISISTIDPMGLRFGQAGITLLKVIAENTGGFPGVSTNDFQASVAQIFHETRSYYLIGYQRTSPKDGKLRKLEVTINQPGVTVLARTGVYAPGPRDTIVKGPTPFDPEVDVAVEALSRVMNGRPFSAYAVERQGSLSVVGELGGTEAAARRWAGGADVEATITRGAGALVTVARGRIAAGTRGIALDVPLTGGPSDGAYHVSIKAIAADRSTLEHGADAQSSGGLLDAPIVFRAGAAARAPLAPAAEFQFARTERMHLEFAARKPVTDPQARVLRRNGEALSVQPVVGDKSIDGRRIVTATFNLSFLAAGDYAFELIARSGEESERKLVAFRVR
jgi:VWFA-related protein